ncbi:hypothetical protein CYMTET_41337 [Cymbomonas tetramitiformis]|uniref:Uncharacterized protein n=1 Tax=Cymbomonas tetramitiformis TaxID=36881 RepID=A0AAE0C6C3_9CHLO|nr:hypothetical protein CYMTET_41337 [Cymbomonas tetramitiformis]
MFVDSLMNPVGSGGPLRMSPTLRSFLNLYIKDIDLNTIINAIKEGTWSSKKGNSILVDFKKFPDSASANKSQPPPDAGEDGAGEPPVAVRQSDSNKLPSVQETGGPSKKRKLTKIDT